MASNSTSRTIYASKNIVSALIDKIVSLILSFISRKLFILYIGIAYLGINGLFANILTILSLADLGLGTAMNISLYKPLAENDTDKLAGLLGYYKKLYRLIAAGVLVIGIGLLPFLPYLVNLNSDIPHLEVYYVLLVLENAVSYLFVYKSAIIRADQKSYLVNKVDILTNVGCVILQIISIMILHSYLVYLLISIARVMVHNVVLSVIADKRYRFINNTIALNQDEKKSIFSNVSSMFLYKVAYTLINGTDNILMSVLCGTVYVGLYSNYYTLTGSIESFVALVFSALTASVGNLVATAKEDKRYETFKTIQLVSFWSCAYISIGLFFLMQDFMQLLFGKELLLDELTVIAIVLNTFFSISMRPIWTFREGTGMYRKIRYIMLGTAILNVLLSVILGKLIGISGIIFATSLSRVSTYFWYEPSILFRDFFHQKPWQYYGPFLQNTLLILCCGAICAVAVSFIKTVSILSWLLKAVICTVVVNGIYLIRYRKTREFSDLLFRVKMVLHGRTANS